MATVLNIPQRISLYPNRRLTEVLFSGEGFFSNLFNAEDTEDFCFYFSQDVLQTLGLASWWTDATDVEQHLA